MIRALLASFAASAIYAPIWLTVYVYVRDNIFAPIGWIPRSSSLITISQFLLPLIAGPILGLILEQTHGELPGPNPLKGIILAPILWLILVATAGINNLLDYAAYAILATIFHILVFGTLLGVLWHLLTGKEEPRENRQRQTDPRKPLTRYDRTYSTMRRAFSAYPAF